MDEPISAVTYPTIDIKGVSYPVKFGNATFYRLEKNGLSLDDVSTRLKAAADKDSPQFGRLGVAMVYDLLAASVGHGFTGEQLAEIVEIQPATAAVIAALGKARPSAETKLREPAPAEIPSVQ